MPAVTFPAASQRHRPTESVTTWLAIALY